MFRKIFSKMCFCVTLVTTPLRTPRNWSSTCWHATRRRLPEHNESALAPSASRKHPRCAASGVNLFSFLFRSSRGPESFGLVPTWGCYDTPIRLFPETPIDRD